MAFGQNGARALIAAVFGGPFADLGPLVFGNGVKPVLAPFTAGQDIAGVRLAGGATAVGLSALAPEEVEGAGDHRFGALEAAQGVGQGCVGTPELLAESGRGGVHSASFML